MKGIPMTLPETRYWVLKLAIFCLVITVDACVHDPFGKPATTGDPGTPVTPVSPVTPPCVYSGTVCFESSVLPIFVSSCAKSGCHDAATRAEGYSLIDYSSIVKRGISAGNANSSKLYKVLFENGENAMPPGAPLTVAQKDSIAAWINQGARNTTNCNCTCDSSKFTYQAIIQPLLATTCVGCHQPASLSAGVDLSTYAGVHVQAANGKLLGSIVPGSGYVAMPPGGKVSDCQVAQIKKWIVAGAANN